MMFLGLGIGSWCWIGAAAVVAVLLFYAVRESGRRVRRDFYKILFDDLQDILCHQAGMTADEAALAVDTLKTRHADPVFPSSIQRIEYALKNKDVSKVTRILAVEYTDVANQKQQCRVEREYDWDFIPDELAAETIRAGKQSINIELYSKKQG